MKAVTVRLPEELHQRAKVRLAERGLSFQELLEEKLHRWLDESPAG
jgi:predicted DNA binding CopG/RHH family protein